MPIRPSTLVALAALAVASAGCPKPPPPPPQPEETAPPPPPPPKCESFTEKCAGKPDTKAKVTNSDLVFTPVLGWTYAQQSSSTIAQSSETGPALALLGLDVDAKDAKKANAAKDAAIAELLKELGISPLKQKVPWKVPAESKPVGTFTRNIWQFEKAGARAGKKGDLLVVTLQVTDSKVVIGVGFVPDDDTTKADVAIMGSIETLGKAP